MDPVICQNTHDELYELEDKQELSIIDNLDDKQEEIMNEEMIESQEDNQMQDEYRSSNM